MASEAELDKKLAELLRMMVDRLPVDKRLPPGVVLQLLRGKYADVYPEAYIASRTDFVRSTVERLTTEKTRQAVTSGSDSSHSDASGSDEESSDDDEESDADSGTDEESSDAVDSSNFHSDADDDPVEEESDPTPETKRVRLEEERAFAAAVSHSQSTESRGDTSTGVSVSARCRAMAEVLKSLSYRVRPRAFPETTEVYLEHYLIPEFRQKGLDPERFSREDVKRYKAKREIEQLQQDGASLTLDKSSRAGRGFADVRLDHDGGAARFTAQPTSYQTSKFLDDED